MEETPASPSVSTPTTTPTKDECTMGMLAHLSALAGFVIPFGNIIGPLVIWLIKKDSSPFVDDQGKESLNFQITIMILFIVSVILMLAFIGFLLVPLVGLLSLIFIIVATIKANGGERYRYPFALRLIK
jgi:uncharacterized protein